MAASVPGAFSDKLKESISTCKLLVVGAGGIGCELIKNLVLSGLINITLIDLDTIDVSNLNRQFLFQKKHVGKSKAEVAKETACKFNPDAKIIAFHDSIFNSKYDIGFFKSFTMVLNALDNRAARNHVNRMCLAADVPLVESGTAGYFGQVTVIKKSLTECYECQPKAAQKTFPGCTIRNTPSEPIHCIVWAKHLFNQLFGESDPDEDVSPDTADPEAAGDAGTKVFQTNQTDTGNVERVSTRAWAVEKDYNPSILFKKLFHDDIEYLLSMDKLWETRRPPTPLDWDNIPEKIVDNGTGNEGMNDMKTWSLNECVKYFGQCIKDLKERLSGMKEDAQLAWDKDDDSCMDFVTACANMRAYIFGIPLKNRFEIKSMAGNIIPAIATTNAIISGLIVMEVIKILQGKINTCKTVYLNRQPNYRKKLLVPCELDKPNPKCYVCSDKPEVILKLNVNEMTVKMFEDKVLKAGLNMVAPDVEIDDGKGTILISSEEGETEGNNDKKLSDFGIKNNSRLKCDDFLQVLELIVNIIHCEECEEGKEFEIIGDLSQLKAKSEAAPVSSENGATASSSSAKQGTSNDVYDLDDDLMVVDIDEPSAESNRKRKRSDDQETPHKKKISKITANSNNAEPEILS